MPIGDWIDCVDRLNQNLINAWGDPIKSRSKRQQWQTVVAEDGTSEGAISFNALYYTLSESCKYHEDAAGVVSIAVFEGKFPSASSQYACKFKYQGKIVLSTGDGTGARPVWNNFVSFYTNRLRSKLEITVTAGAAVKGMLNLDLFECCQKFASSWYTLDNNKEIRMRLGFKPIEDLQSLPLSKSIAPQLPIGVLKIMLTSAESLPDTISTVYVNSYLQGRRLGTTTVQDTYNAVHWNETFYTPLYNFQEILCFDLFESSTLVKDKKIGSVNVKLESIIGSAGSIIKDNIDV
jgi:hypothetical protein